MGKIRHVHSQQGFGLVSAIVSLGVIITLSVVISDTLAQFYRLSDSKIKRGQAAVIYSDIDALLADREICGQTFSGVPLGAGSIVNATVPVNTVIPGTTIKLGKGQIIDDFYRVEQADLQILPEPPVRIPVWNGSKSMYYQYEGQLRIGLTYISAGQDTALRPITVHLKLLATNAGALTSCSNRSLEMVNCAVSGGIWDLTATSELLRCQPLDHCRNMGSFTDPAAPLELRFLNVMSGGHSCPAGSRQYISGYVSGFQPAGKYSSTSQTYPIYNCVQCGPDAPANTTGSIAQSTVFDFEADAKAADGAINNFCNSTACNGPPRGTCPQGEAWICDPRADPSMAYNCSCRFRYLDPNVNPTGTDPCKVSGNVWTFVGSPSPAHWWCMPVPIKTPEQCYLERYPDICINSPNNYCKQPKVHYDTIGKNEGRIWGCP